MEFKRFMENNIVLFDGAMGTMLQNKGLKLGENPEIFNFKESNIIIDIHKEYLESGANVITTNTFGANELKLKDIGYSVEEVVDKAVTLAKEAIGSSNAYVALDIGPIGELLEPMGTLSFDRAYEIFKRQIVQGVKSGANVILIETMTDLYEAKAAILAAKENCDLPILCTMSFEANGRTFTGCTPASMALTLEGLGANAIGVNCSLGPKELLPIIKEIADWSKCPIMVQPNAGLPKIVEGQAVYDISEKEFTDGIIDFIEAGANIVGGCCGTNPNFIKAVRERIKTISPKVRESKGRYALCSPSKVVEINGVEVIGERINPTGKKLFKEALKNGDIDYILNQGIEQVNAGAGILDVNVGLPEINEPEMMKKVVKEIQSILDTPLQIDSSDVKAIESGLRYYNGKPIVNSVNGEEAVLDKILPLVKKYGAAVVGLTLDEKGIPKKAEERYEIAKRILDKAVSYGINKEDVYIDTLVLTASAQQEEVVETLKALRLVTENLGLKTVLGVSNISFGLPNRPIINETFLALALGHGLSLPIMNPNSEGMMKVINSYNVLYNYDKGSAHYIECYGKVQSNTEPVVSTKKSDDRNLIDIVIKGLKEEAEKSAENLLNSKSELEIVNEYLIPALDIVGKKFEKNEIFLPQLIQSAETVKRAFEILKSSLLTKNTESISKGKIVLATVKGDIHDIGKNIVKVILENYGYQIIDLGKDVPIEEVVKAVKEHEVKLVGLSALMTTTLKSMEETIKALKDEKLDVVTFVGGAVLTEEYANMIGADYYARDARESVDIAKKIIG